MPSTYLSLHYHLVFGTKNREPTIAAEWRSRLHEYLGGTIAGLGGFPQGVGGVADHVHLALRISRTTHVSELVKQLKVNSSVWVKDNFSNSAKFAWQRGYGAFSVGPADLNSLIWYIDTQASHHAKQNFQDEMRAFLKRYGIECEERYLWD